MLVTGMWSSDRTKGQSTLFLGQRFNTCTRALLSPLGLCGVIWASITLPAFRSAAPAKDVAARILIDDRFRSGALIEVLQHTEFRSVHRSDLIRADALIRLRIAEESTARKSSKEADREMAAAGSALQSSLLLNPGDSFLWLMSYSQEIKSRGLNERTVGLLNQSYATGPLEGWIALRRNRAALAAFTGLAEAVQSQVVAEFAAMVNSEFVADAALNIMGVGWPQKDRLLASLVNVELIPREAFAKKLSREGLKVSVPGVELDDRLWR